jgi:hypothetical protein
MSIDSFMVFVIPNEVRDLGFAAATGAPKGTQTGTGY